MLLGGAHMGRKVMHFPQGLMYLCVSMAPMGVGVGIFSFFVFIRARCPPAVCKDIWLSCCVSGLNHSFTQMWGNLWIQQKWTDRAIHQGLMKVGHPFFSFFTPLLPSLQYTHTDTYLLSLSPSISWSSTCATGLCWITPDWAARSQRIWSKTICICQATRALNSRLLHRLVSYGWQ